MGIWVVLSAVRVRYMFVQVVHLSGKSTLVGLCSLPALVAAAAAAAVILSCLRCFVYLDSGCVRCSYTLSAHAAPPLLVPPADSVAAAGPGSSRGE